MKKSIEKSPRDKKEYKALTLKNGLEVLLISDSETKTAAASMNVDVGSFHDPENVPGLTHFLEHMLFLGTKKYPNPDTYGKYLSENGGQSNAYTASESTNYHFHVSKDKLEGALDRFAQFFIEPLFSKNMVDRELNAVNAEHEKNLQSDMRKILQVQKATVNQKHPYHKFGTGNRETLQQDSKLRETLIQHYQKYYSANTMNLVVLGKENLEELEKMVKNIFSSIPNRKLEIEKITEPIFESNTLPVQVNIKPIREIRTLSLQFPLPSLEEYYRSKPLNYIGHFLGDEGEGSILSFLKKKGWANNLSAGGGYQNSNFSFFNISVELTQKGMKHTSEIVNQIFQYFYLLETNGIESWRFEEMKKLREIQFQFQEEVEPIHYVIHIASQMKNYPPSEILTGIWTIQDYKPDLILDILKSLKPENMKLTLVAPNTETDKIEPWYQTKYKIQSIPLQDIQTWNDARYGKQTIEQLALPKENILIPSDLSIQAIQNPKLYPELILNTDQVKLWFLQDHTFLIPKANWNVFITTPKAYDSIKNATMTQLIVMLWKDALNEYTYPANIAGLQFAINHDVDGISLGFGGYQEKLPILIKKVVQEMMELKIDPKRLEIFRNVLRRKWENQKLSPANQQSSYRLYYLLQKNLWHRDNYLNTISIITQKDIENFLPTLLEQIHIQAFAHGNITEVEAKNTIQNVTSLIKGKTLPQNQFPKKGWGKLPKQVDLIDQQQVLDVNSAIQIYLQSNERTLKEEVKLELLAQMLQKPFYHQLRTIEQLGYIVWSYPMKSRNVYGLSLVIQSPDKTPIFLRDRIEAFLTQFTESLQNIPTSVFESHKTSLSLMYQEKFKNLGTETHFYWKEIRTKNKNFQKKEEKVALLKSIQLKDIITLFKQLTQESTKRSIILQSFGKHHAIQKDVGTQIQNDTQFKKQQTYYYE